MADAPSSEQKNSASGSPAPEELKPESAEASAENAVQHPATAERKEQRPMRRGTYRPSHKATFLSLIVVGAILAINAGVIVFVLKHNNADASKQNQGQVTISADALDKLGVSSNQVNDTGIQLTINPNTHFGGDVQVAGKLNVSGALVLNNGLTASSASIKQLQSDTITVNKLNVNGDGTLSNLAIRQSLAITGSTTLQGTTTVDGLLTVNNNMNVSGNLAVGGTLAVGAFQANNLTIAGHVLTVGSTPGVSRGSASGPSGTVSVGGTDAAGSVVANAGVGAGSGEVACVTFHNSYSTIPIVVVTASAPLNTYISTSTSGFCIYIGSSMSAGNGYVFNYIVEQ